jgi:DNA-binding IclR family transcriptional regulator
MSPRDSGDHASGACERRLVQSASRAVRLISTLLCCPDGKQLADLSEELALPKATLLRLLHTLTAEGAVWRHASGRYLISAHLWLSLVMTFPEAAELCDGYAELLGALAHDTGATASLEIASRPTNSMITSSYCLPREHGPLLVYPTLGVPCPIHATAAGMVFLAALPEGEVGGWLGGEFRAVTSHTLTDCAALQERLAQVRRDGCALEVEELRPGCWGVAVAILDRNGRPAGALQLSAPTATIPPARARQWLPELRQAAQRAAQLITPVPLPARRRQRPRRRFVARQF